MALALITEVHDGKTGPVLEVDTGSNRFARYSIGSGSREEQGFDVLEGVTYESPIRPRFGPGAFQTRIDIEVDGSQLDRDHRHVQVTTFRSASGAGPAWSRVVTVLPPIGGGGGSTGVVGDDGLPAFRRPTMSAELIAAAASTRSAPMTVRESSMSAAMDWGALLGLVDDLAPIAQQMLEFAGDEKVQEGASGLVKILGPLVEQVLGGAGALAGGLLGGGAAPAGPSAAPAVAPAAPATVVAPAAARPVAPSPAPQPVFLLQPTCPPGTVHPAAPTTATTAPASAVAPVRPQSTRVVRALDGGVISIPALLGIVSAVAPMVMKGITPLLEKSPEMFQTYMDHPIKMINALAGAERMDQELINQQVNSLLNQGNQQLLLTILQGLGQGGGANAVTPGALAGLGTAGRPTAGGGTSAMSVGRWRRAAHAGRPSVGTLRGRARSFSASRPSVRSTAPDRDDRAVDARIEAMLVPPTPIPGAVTTKALYASGGAIGLRLSLTTPQAPPNRPVPHVVAHVRVSDAAAGDLLLERRVELRAVYLNQPVDVVLDAAAAVTLPTGRDLTVSVDATWTGGDGRAYTTPRRAVQNMCLIGGAFIVESGRRTGEEVALSDPQQYRAFWHRIWEGGSASHSRWELNATARYYYTLAVDQPSNARMETKFRPVDERSKNTGSKVEWGGLLKSGMELSPDVLNLLLPEMGEALWSPDDLAALRSEVVSRSVATKAEVDIHLRGRTEERGAVWAFPVVSLVELVVHRPASVTRLGAVAATTTETRRFPLPVAAVFVGMENEG